MDNQIRNFKDFLQLYNKVTEMCFVHCVDNFFTRDLSTTESNCLDKCVLKFSNVNQRVMAAYIRDQAIINERRMKEMEDQARAQEAALAASAAAAAAAAAAVPASKDLVVESINQQNPIEIPENTYTIAGKMPIEETITTASDATTTKSTLHVNKPT